MSHHRDSVVGYEEDGPCLSLNGFGPQFPKKKSHDPLQLFFSLTDVAYHMSSCVPMCFKAFMRVLKISLSPGCFKHCDGIPSRESSLCLQISGWQNAGQGRNDGMKVGKTYQSQLLKPQLFSPAWRAGRLGRAL